MWVISAIHVAVKFEAGGIWTVGRTRVEMGQ
jgi:hypothetical protein